MTPSVNHEPKTTGINDATRVALHKNPENRKLAKYIKQIREMEADVLHFQVLLELALGKDWKPQPLDERDRTIVYDVYKDAVSKGGAK